MKDLHIRVPGKWVLAGEHSVLQGGTAVALPLPELSLSLEFRETGDGGTLRVEPPSAQPLIDSLIQAAKAELELKGGQFAIPRGSMRLESGIPFGAGLGSSAALCVAITRWLGSAAGIPENEFFSFARRLEDGFHGKSSGMDIAAVLAERPIVFSMESGARVLQVEQLPRFTFHDTGKRARTSDCVAQVQRYRAEQPARAKELDEAMSLAAQRAEKSLQDCCSREALASIASAMRVADECFQQWGLVPEEAKSIQRKLLSEGALATKITGAGGGGMVVALWPEDVRLSAQRA